jgi:hypothetical protein
LKNIIPSKETQLTLKKLYQKIRQIVVEWHNHTMVVEEVVVVVCVDHHPEWVVVEGVAVDGDRWAVDRIMEAVVEELVDIDQVVVVVVMEPAEIMVIELPRMVVATAAIWVVGG